LPCLPAKIQTIRVDDVRPEAAYDSMEVLWAVENTAVTHSRIPNESIQHTVSLDFAVPRKPLDDRDAGTCSSERFCPLR
jgi:hypothetical protein